MDETVEILMLPGLFLFIYLLITCLFFPFLPFSLQQSAHCFPEKQDRNGQIISCEL